MEVGITFWARQVLKDSGCVRKCESCRSCISVFIKDYIINWNNPDSHMPEHRPPLQHTDCRFSAFPLYPAFIPSCEIGKEGTESRKNSDTASDRTGLEIGYRIHVCLMGKTWLQ